jgi:nitroimidazol reductase NimA-like FMN-containing flavoprotein (pyridoxamine 5'-phosphate oxidase superfamily)
MSNLSWLHETPWPTRQLPRDELAQRIEHFLATHWMGVLCTISAGGPIGSPVEFYAEGMAVYILPQPGSPKIKAMQRDPRICFAVHAENAGWASVRGAQLFAKSQLIEPGTAEHERAMTIYRWQASAVQLGGSLEKPPEMQLLKVDPDKIVYTEQWLRKDGYGPRQIWHKDPDHEGLSIQYGHK